MEAMATIMVMTPTGLVGRSERPASSSSTVSQTERRPDAKLAARLAELGDVADHPPSLAALDTPHGYAVLRERLRLTIRGYGASSDHATRAAHHLIEYTTAAAAALLLDAAASPANDAKGLLPSLADARKFGSASVMVPPSAGAVERTASVLLAAAEAALAKFGEARLEAAWLNNAALLQRRIKRPRTALRLLAAALRLESEAGDELAVAQTLLNMSACHSKLDAHEDALQAGIEAKSLLAPYIREFFSRFTAVASGEEAESHIVQVPGDAAMLRTILGVFNNIAVEHDHLRHHADAAKAYSIGAEIAARTPGVESVAQRLRSLAARSQAAAAEVERRVGRKLQTRRAGLPAEARRRERRKHRTKTQAGPKGDRLQMAYGASAADRAAAARRLQRARDAATVAEAAGASTRLGAARETASSGGFAEPANFDVLELPPLTAAALGLSQDEFDRLMATKAKAVELDADESESRSVGSGRVFGSRLTSNYSMASVKPWLQPADPTMPTRDPIQLRRTASSASAARLAAFESTDNVAHSQPRTRTRRRRAVQPPPKSRSGSSGHGSVDGSECGSRSKSMSRSEADAEAEPEAGAHSGSGSGTYALGNLSAELEDLGDLSSMSSMSNMSGSGGGGGDDVDLEFDSDSDGSGRDEELERDVDAFLASQTQNSLLGADGGDETGLVTSFCSDDFDLDSADFDLSATSP
ncbi:uncharacterized protein AMSG_10983 [Thecamonas trahens ATCC 50062]|uniref:Uncharacterized protein n=1 Tax=Thecamonas trahens ATCC 50062 TaxID=461836 RepID=A0A0L0DSK8_THETB|nr:hypothetical protein AMSG_10983 [Thecamonas trahens ATCC 50062]KNC55334.1 hypothetical protein AMSG_10983 [Thecamonas trahens ATCC 50062]|eukprot:XP_013753055.1 hypothetical protein AMSG_10983 [Thecamonas trahens ATCC 50062]